MLVALLPGDKHTKAWGMNEWSPGDFQEKADNMEGWLMLGRHITIRHGNISKSPQKCYICTEEGMVQKRACKATTCWVYKYTYTQFCWMTRPVWIPYKKHASCSHNHTQCCCIVAWRTVSIAISSAPTFDLCITDVFSFKQGLYRIWFTLMYSCITAFTCA